MRQQHWVFDMDGTLTIAAHDFPAIKRELGIPEDQPIVRTLNEMPEAQAAPLRVRLQEIEAEIARQAQPAPGVYDLLETLTAQGRRLGILTLNSRENAWITLEALDLAHFFEPASVLGRWCLKNPKPAPDGLNHLLQHWQSAPDDAVMVGDFRWDLETGRAAGVATVHIDPSAAFPWPELTDHRFSSLTDLQQQLQSPTAPF